SEFAATIPSLEGFPKELRATKPKRSPDRKIAWGETFEELPRTPFNETPVNCREGEPGHRESGKIADLAIGGKGVDRLVHSWIMAEEHHRGGRFVQLLN